MQTRISTTHFILGAKCFTDHLYIIFIETADAHIINSHFPHSEHEAQSEQ